MKMTETLDGHAAGTGGNFDVDTIKGYLKSFSKFHKGNLYDDLFHRGFEFARSVSTVKKEIPRTIWTAVLCGDLVKDAGLMNPVFHEEFDEFKKNMLDCVDGPSQASFLAFLKNYDSLVEIPTDMFWFASVLMVMACFTTWKLVEVKKEAKEKHAHVSDLISERRRQSDSLVYGSSFKSDEVTRGTLLNVPDFRFCFLLDFACSFNEEAKTTEVIGVAQTQVNHRSADPETLQKMENAYKLGNDAAVMDKTWMYTDEKAVMFYAAASAPQTYPDESKTDIEKQLPSANDVIAAVTGATPNVAEGDGEEALGEVALPSTRISGALVLPSDMNAESAVSVGSRHPRSVQVGDALRFALLWCGTRSCADGLKKAGYKLEFDKNDSLLTGILKKGPVVVDQTDDDPNIVITILSVGLNGTSGTEYLTRVNVCALVNRMMCSYMVDRYDMKKVGRDIADGGYVDGLEPNMETYMGDKIGMMWLVNLASHRVRMGSSSGRHRFVTMLMAMCGCTLHDKDSRPPYHKHNEMEQRLVESDFILHQVNASNSTRACLCVHSRFLATVREEVKFSVNADIMSDQKVANTFGGALHKALESAVKELETIKGFCTSNKQWGAYLAPNLFSVFCVFTYRIDTDEFDPGMWSLKYGERNSSLKANVRGSKLVQLQEIVTDLCDSPQNLVNRQYIAARFSADPTTSYQKAAKTFIDKYGTGDSLQFQKIGPLSHSVVKNALNPCFHKTFCDKVILSMDGNTYTDKTKQFNSCQYKPEEMVHLCIYTTLFRHLVSDPIFSANWNHTKRNYMGGVVKSYLTGSITKGSGLGSIRPLSTRDAHLPDNLQMLLCVLTILLSHPRGKNILYSYFFTSSVGQEEHLKKMYVHASLLPISHWSVQLFGLDSKTNEVRILGVSGSNSHRFLIIVSLFQDGYLLKFEAKLLGESEAKILDDPIRKEIYVPSVKLFESIELMINATTSTDNKMKSSVSRFKNMVWRNVVNDVVEANFHYGRGRLDLEVVKDQVCFFMQPIKPKLIAASVRVADVIDMIVFMMEKEYLKVNFEYELQPMYKNAATPVVEYAGSKNDVKEVGYMDSARPRFFLAQFYQGDQNTNISSKDSDPGWIPLPFNLTAMISILAVGKANWFNRPLGVLDDDDISRMDDLNDFDAATTEIDIRAAFKLFATKITTEFSNNEDPVPTKDSSKRSRKQSKPKLPPKGKAKKGDGGSSGKAKNAVGAKSVPKPNATPRRSTREAKVYTSPPNKAELDYSEEEEEEEYVSEDSVSGNGDEDAAKQESEEPNEDLLQADIQSTPKKTTKFTVDLDANSKASFSPSAGEAAGVGEVFQVTEADDLVSQMESLDQTMALYNTGQQSHFKYKPAHTLQIMGLGLKLMMQAVVAHNSRKRKAATRVKTETQAVLNLIPSSVSGASWDMENALLMFQHALWRILENHETFWLEHDDDAKASTTKNTHMFTNMFETRVSGDEEKGDPLMDLLDSRWTSGKKRFQEGEVYKGVSFSTLKSALRYYEAAMDDRFKETVAQSHRQAAGEELLKTVKDAMEQHKKQSSMGANDVAKNVDMIDRDSDSDNEEASVEIPVQQVAKKRKRTPVQVSAGGSVGKELHFQTHHNPNKLSPDDQTPKPDKKTRGPVGKKPPKKKGKK